MSLTNKPVEVVVVTDVKGHMLPIRFRLIAEDETEQVIKIEKSQLKQSNKIYRIYSCLVIINGQKHVVELQYMIDSCRWILYSIK